MEYNKTSFLKVLQETGLLSHAADVGTITPQWAALAIQLLTLKQLDKMESTQLLILKNLEQQ